METFQTVCHKQKYSKITTAANLALFPPVDFCSQCTFHANLFHDEELHKGQVLPDQPGSLLWWHFCIREQRKTHWCHLSEDQWDLWHYPNTFFFTNWRGKDLMGGMFDRWGTGYKIILREWWSMAQGPNWDQWWMVSYWVLCKYSLTFSSIMEPSVPSARLWVALNCVM